MSLLFSPPASSRQTTGGFIIAGACPAFRLLAAAGALLTSTLVAAWGSGLPSCAPAFFTQSSGSPLRAENDLSAIFDPTANVSTRLKCVHALGPALNSDQITRLYQFLKARPDSRESNLPALRLIKNDLLNALMDQSIAPAGLTAVMSDIYHDEAQDLVSRDYALQHLVTWCEQGAPDASDSKSKARAVLVEAAEQNTAVGGAALLGLHQLAAWDPAMSRDFIRKRALQMASSAGAAIEMRTTALQVCAEEGIAEALPVARSLAFGEAPAALRISAIAAVGRLGGPADLVALQLEEKFGAPLRPAIQSAIKNLELKIHRQKLV